MALPISGTINDNQAGILRPRKTATPLIINGDMAIAQRNTTKTGITADGYYTVDRFLIGLANLGTWTQSQSTDVPTGQGFSNSLKLDCTTADASPASTDNIAIMQRLEGQNLQMLKKGTSDAESVTVSFWVKTNKTGTYVLELRDADNVRIICKTYTVDSANTWEKKVLSFAGDTTGALDNDRNLSFHARWWLGAGSDFTSGTLQTTWGAQSNANRAVGQTVNLADSTSNEWYITGIQMEVGSFDSNSIPDFQFEDRTTSLTRCQRYYMRIGGEVSDDNVFGSGYSTSSTAVRFVTSFPTTLRAPATAIETTGTASDYRILGGGASVKNMNAVPTFNACGTTSARTSGTVASGLTTYNALIVDTAVDDTFLAWDSEL